jgi:hypothetical protein
VSQYVRRPTLRLPTVTLSSNRPELAGIGNICASGEILAQFTSRRPGSDFVALARPPISIRLIDWLPIRGTIIGSDYQDRNI